MAENRKGIHRNCQKCYRKKGRRKGKEWGETWKLIEERKKIKNLMDLQIREKTQTI